MVAGDPPEPGSPAIADTVGLGPSGSGDAGPIDDAPAPRRGETVDRFVVLEMLGHGGMGVVVAAYDPKLDRKVALKLLRRDLAPTDGGTEARARLVREAQVMAKLRHPNVVTVFEVGEYRGQVFLAMEHVAGGTLGAWTAQRRAEPRGWQHIVAAFVQAGRGLEAAHAQGLVHRDFKPANVLVEGERFQVSDFGIASIGGRAPAPGPATSVVRDCGSEPTLTVTGHVVGTAPYMAPELAAGEPADEATDQFAFCVALYESLYGVRPFAGTTIDKVQSAIESGKIVAPRRDHGVPPWLHQVVMRGLSIDPARRWPSMAHLLRMLDSPDAAGVERRTRLLMAVATGLLFVAVPYAAKALGPPFDRSSYAGCVAQTLSLLAIVLAASWIARRAVWATSLNRKAFGAVVSVLAMQLPLELGNAALGVTIEASDIQHLVLWAAMSSMFAVTTDRRFLILSGLYLLWLPAALVWPSEHVLVLGLSNACFAVFVTIVWRDTDHHDAD